MSLNLGLLYIAVHVLGISFALAPVVTSEIGITLRFLVNDRWVFGYRRPSWRRLWEYHVAIAGAFVVWWVAANLMVHAGVHYLIASILATACSVCCSVITNFLWVWQTQSGSGSKSAPQANGAPENKALSEARGNGAPKEL